MVENSSGSFLRCSNFLPGDEEAALGPLGPLRKGDRGRGTRFPKGEGPPQRKKKKRAARGMFISSFFLVFFFMAFFSVTNCCFSIGLIVDICLFKTTAVEHLRAAKRRCGSLSAALLVPVNVCRSECATLFQPLFLLSRTSVTGPSFTSWMFM